MGLLMSGRTGKIRIAVVAAGRPLKLLPGGYRPFPFFFSLGALFSPWTFRSLLSLPSFGFSL